MMPWLLFSVGVVSAWLTWNAWRPMRAPGGLALFCFFAGWLTAELALHHVVLQAVVVLVLARAGALDGWQGQVGLALTLLSWLFLLLCYHRGHEARATVDSALRTGLGAGWEQRLDPALGERLRPALEWWQLLAPLPVTHRETSRVRGLAYHQIGKKRLLLDVWRARAHAAATGPAPAPAPALLYVHGGGWVIGDKDTQGLPLVQHLAARGWVCFSIDYRLSPRATFPDHLVDVKRAIAWVKAHAAEYGADPQFLVIAGNSAGGHLASLAALTANAPEYQPGFEEADTAVAGCVPFYGVYDFTDRHGHWPHDGLARLVEKHVMKLPRASSREAYEQASPLARVHAGAPPFFVIHGDRDTLVPVAEARAFVAALRRVRPDGSVAYAEIRGAQHAFEIFPSLRTAHVIRGVARFGAWLYARRERSDSDVAAANGVSGGGNGVRSSAKR